MRNYTYMTTRTRDLLGVFPVGSVASMYSIFFAYKAKMRCVLSS